MARNVNCYSRKNQAFLSAAPRKRLFFSEVNHRLVIYVSLKFVHFCAIVCNSPTTSAITDIELLPYIDTPPYAVPSASSKPQPVLES